MGTTGVKGEEDAEMMGHVSYPMKKLHDRNRFQSGDLLLQSTKKPPLKIKVTKKIKFFH